MIEKYKIVGSIARVLLKTLEKNGVIKCIEKHSKQVLYTPVAVPVEKAPAAEKEAPAKKGKKK